MPPRDFPIPETRVLLIASHVVYGYVGNKTASYVLQALGCDVSALNTVHFSNHTAYKQWTGTKQSGDEMHAIWDGLKKSELTDPSVSPSSGFDMMLTGYCPGPAAVEAAGYMARELRTAATMRPGSFFWILDPVMGDEGKLYVDPGVVPVYRSLLDHADLIVPNQFELETLAGTGEIDSWEGMLSAVERVHKEYRVPHVLVTSVRLPPLGSSSSSSSGDGNGGNAGTGTGSDTAKTLSVLGSTRTTTTLQPRAFYIPVPEFPVFFAGTGDLLASLVAVRLREAAGAAELLGTASWLSPDDVPAEDLPLARATGMALASMHAVLEKTVKASEEGSLAAAAAAVSGRVEGEGASGAGAGAGGRQGGAGDNQGHDAAYLHRRKTQAAELKIVRNVGDLLDPPDVLRFKARALESRTLPQNRG